MYFPLRLRSIKGPPEGAHCWQPGPTTRVDWNILPRPPLLLPVSEFEHSSLVFSYRSTDPGSSTPRLAASLTRCLWPQEKGAHRPRCGCFCATAFRGNHAADSEGTHLDGLVHLHSSPGHLSRPQADACLGTAGEGQGWTRPHVNHDLMSLPPDAVPYKPVTES